MYKSLSVESTRSARLLGGNRSIAEVCWAGWSCSAGSIGVLTKTWSQPFTFVAGEDPKAAQSKDTGDSAGGLFIGGSGPSPPKALGIAVVGMKQGGKVRSLGCVIACRLSAAC